MELRKLEELEFVPNQVEINWREDEKRGLSFDKITSQTMICTENLFANMQLSVDQANKCLKERGESKLNAFSSLSNHDPKFDDQIPTLPNKLSR